MAYEADSGGPAGVVSLGEPFPLLALPSELETDMLVKTSTIGYRNFLLTGVEELPPLKMQVVASDFGRSAVRSIHTQQLSVIGNRGAFLVDGISRITGKEDFGRQLVEFPTEQLGILLRLRLQVSLGHIIYEANPNYSRLLVGSLVFSHFYVERRSEDVSREALLYAGDEPLMAVLDNSEVAYHSSIGDERLRFELVGDIKEKEHSKVRGKFLLESQTSEEYGESLKRIEEFLTRMV